MKKSALSLAGLAVGLTAAIAAPAAHAAVPFPHVNSDDSSNDKSVEVMTSDYMGSGSGHPGGWCANGVPTSLIAIRNTHQTRTLYVELSWNKNDGNETYEHEILTFKNVTPNGVMVVPMPTNTDFDSNRAGSGQVSYAVDTELDPFDHTHIQSTVDQSVNGSVIPNDTCAGLSKTMPSLPSQWGSAPVSTPTKSSTPVVTPTKKPTPTKTAPAPTKSSTPVVVPTHPTTKPAPVVTPKPGTSSASATATVKVTTPGGTKTTSTTAVVPVTKPVPAGGVTQTATVKVPSKGTTVKSTVTVNPITPSVQPTSSSSSATTGPKIQTDKVSGSNSSMEAALAGAIGLTAIAGGATVVARRRR